jgi:hypothetical protein
MRVILCHNRYLLYFGLLLALSACNNEVNTTINTTVNTTDVVPPVIRLIGDVKISIVEDVTYIELGATVTDNVDMDLTATITGIVDSSIVGQYVLSYNAFDTAGNEATVVKRTVSVIDVTSPKIALIGFNPMNVSLGTDYAEPGATVTDNVDANLSAAITGTVDLSIVGQYILSYSAVDVAGNEANVVTRVVDVIIDITPPVITLIGDNPMMINQDSTYQELGAIIEDNVDRDLIGLINGTVDTSVVGEYLISYSVVDVEGNKAIVVTRKVIVIDITPPVVSLNGSASIDIDQDSTYIELGATVTDNVDADLTTMITGTVDSSIAGQYVLSYNAIDAAGNEATVVKRTVSVIDIISPAITLNGDDFITIEKGAIYSDLGATATDNVDMYVSVIVNNSVDVANVGEYVLIYSASDRAGNEAAVVNRIVTVVDTTAPKIINTFPVPSAKSVAQNTIITAGFNEDIFAKSVGSSSVYLDLRGSIDGAVTFEALDNVVTFSPVSELSLLAKYKATISKAIIDLSGNSLVKDYSWTFITSDGHWGAPSMIETYDPTDRDEYSPQIDIDGSGNAIAIWQQSEGNVISIWAKPYNAETGLWGSASALENDNTVGHNAYNPRISIDANGNAIAVWQQTDGSASSIWANRYNVSSGLWSTAEEIENDRIIGNDATNPQIGFDSKGNAISLWQQYDGSVHSIWANRYDASAGTWGAAEEIENDNAVGHSAMAPQFDFDAMGNAIAVWKQSDGAVLSIWSNRYSAVSGLWGVAEVIEADNTAGHHAYRPSIGVDASGNAVSVWTQTDDAVRSVWANRYSSVSGLWGRAVLIETDTDNNAYSPRVGLDAHGNAIAVWGSAGQGPRVRSNRYNSATDSWGREKTIGSGANAEIGVDLNGNAIAVFSKYGARFDATTGLWNVIYLDSDHASLGRPQIVISSNGAGIAIWGGIDNNSFKRIWARNFE